jgi:thiol-disulfide isomerase/thioredoxin
MSKSIIWTHFFLLFLLTASAQIIKVNGVIQHFANSSDSIELNLPLTGEYYRSNSVFSKVTKKGAFEFQLTSQGPLFSQIIYGKKKHWLLLSPGRDLNLSIDTFSQNQMFAFSGAARSENDILANLEPDGGLFFSQRNAKGRVQGPYLNWTEDSILQTLLPKIKSDMERDEGIIRESEIPLKLKNCLQIDLKYYYADEFITLAGTWASRNGIRRYLRLADSATKTFGLPLERELAVSNAANRWLQLFADAKLEIANFTYSYVSDKQNADSIFKSRLGISHEYFWDTVKNKFGNNYAFDLEGLSLLSGYAAERWLAARIEVECELSDLRAAKSLMKIWSDNYPSGKLQNACAAKINSLDESNLKFASDVDVHIRPDYRQISSLRELLAPYKGKVVYLDLWGTWCGPCADQMKFEPQLRDKFRNSDVTFLFVDDDPDQLDSKWRTYIQVNDLKGEHVRIAHEQLQKIWEELSPPDHRNLYPTYFIADRDGNLSVRVAKRPSDQNALYEQIAEVLAKK